MLPKPFVIALGITIGALSPLAFGQSTFYRGDCNMSGESDGTAVDIADAAALVSYLFGGSSLYQPPCLDACDANDDGVVDMSDPLFVIVYVFRFGPFPPPPGPGLIKDASGVHLTPPGEDPTDDRLDCGTAI